MKNPLRFVLAGQIAVLSAIFLIGLAGCVNPAQESRTPSNAEFKVDTLFKHEGCTVYRFNDGGDYVYYTVCDNARPVQTQYNYTENCGKNCTRSVELHVPTAYYSPVQES